MRIKAILFDFIGTTVLERDPSAINHCFVRAFGKFGIQVPLEIIVRGRGMDKKEMIASLLQVYPDSKAGLEEILGTLENEIQDDLDNFYENEGFRELLTRLKGGQIRVGLGTGLPRASLERIMGHLHGEKQDFDFIGVSEEIGRGRPHPDMILKMLKEFRVKPNEFLKVGDTVADILEGKNAGVNTAVILSGTQEVKLLQDAKPDHLLDSIADLYAILGP